MPVAVIRLSSSVLLSLLILSGCGSGVLMASGASTAPVAGASTSSTTPSQVAVSVGGASLITISTPVQYKAYVTGATNTAVNWTIAGTSVNEHYGSISATGLYTPPASVPVHGAIKIVATSQADSAKTSAIAATITNPTPAISSATLTAGQHSTFLVDVLGSNFMPASDLTYSGYGVATTYVSSTELKFTLSTPPAAGSLVTLGVITPAPGRTQSANYSVVMPALIGVTAIGGATATAAAQPTQYSATVTGTSNPVVSWSIVGSSATENYGTISASGLYIPPPLVPSHNLIKIMATSRMDTTKWSSVPVTILNEVPLLASATAVAGAHGVVSIDVKGTGFHPPSTVMYSGYGLATTYVSSTHLTAVIPANTVAALTAGLPISVSVTTPNPGKTQSASLSVPLPGQVGVAVAGSSLATVGVPSQYIAIVTGSLNNAVTWAIKSADGSDPGTISTDGMYTPSMSTSLSRSVTLTASSQEQPLSIGSLTVMVSGVSAAAAARILDQSTFGPTDSTIAHVQTVGLSNYIDEQIALPATLLPRQSTFAGTCGMNPAVCMDENYWHDIVTAPDQLRQRVSMALQAIMVVSYNEADSTMVGAYSNILTQDAFVNWSKIMKDVTLSPAMGVYLNMQNSGKPAAGAIANENFARENMQLFNLGLNLLNQDGSPQTDGSGNPMPAFTEANVEAFSRAFTGWTWATPAGVAQTFPNWNANPYVPMVATQSAHDMTQKVLLKSTLPSGQSAEQDLDGAIQDIFNHPNVAPFVTRQLIQHLVKSNPSPSYVGRMAAVFADDGAGVRGNMAAVIKAILLDPEARAGDTQLVVDDGYLREPIIWTANVLRALNVVPKPGVTDVSAYTAIDSFASNQQQRVFYSPTVFNFYPASFDLAGTGLNAPQFALETSATIMAKLTLASSVVNNMLGKLTVDLSATSPLGKLAVAGNDALLDELSKLFLHGTMSIQMRSAIQTALSGISDPAQRVRTAVYLVIVSSQYKVIH